MLYFHCYYFYFIPQVFLSLFIPVLIGTGASSAHYSEWTDGEFLVFCVLCVYIWKYSNNMKFSPIYGMYILFLRLFLSIVELSNPFFELRFIVLSFCTLGYFIQLSKEIVGPWLSYWLIAASALTNIGMAWRCVCMVWYVYGVVWYSMVYIRA